MGNMWRKPWQASWRWLRGCFVVVVVRWLRDGGGLVVVWSEEVRGVVENVARGGRRRVVKGQGLVEAGVWWRGGGAGSAFNVLLRVEHILLNFQ